MWFVILIAVIILLVIYFRYRKIPKLGSMTLVSGGIKTGKSTLSVYLAIRKYKQNVRIWKIRRFLLKIFKPKTTIPEKPLFYSNIPLKIPYVPITRDLLLRQKRFNYKSVAYICESSLIADSQLIRDPLINEQLLLFNKLFAHETRGGSIFYDTQSISDCHYSIKRCLSSFLYIHHMYKFVPFVLFMWVREFKFSEDNSVVNTVENDLEDNLKLIIVPKSVWKKFDCYCFSSFTDDLPIEKNEKISVSLKVDDLVSFREFRQLKIKKSEAVNNDEI